MRIDIHAHFHPENCLEFLLDEGARYNPILELDEHGRKNLRFANRAFNYGPHTPDFFDPETKIREMKEMGIEMQVLYPAPFFYFYWVEADLGVKLARFINDGTAKMARDYPDRFIGAATVPLQDVDAAVEELERAVSQLGLKAVGIGSNVDGRDLDDPALRPFFEKAQALGIPVLVHPCSDSPRYGDHYLIPILAFPFDTTTAITKLILSRVPEEFPDLRFCFAHAGGTIPFLMGRLDHGYAYRSAWPKILPKRPSEYLKSMYFDSIVYHPQTLAYLAQMLPADRIVLGTDHPFDMTERQPVQIVKSAPVTDEVKELILEKNAANLLRI